MTLEQLIEQAQTQLTDPKLQDLLRAGLADKNDVEDVKRAIRMGEKSFTNPRLRDKLYRTFDRLLSIVKQDSNVRSRVRQDLQKQVHAKDTEVGEAMDLTKQNVDKAIAHDCAKHVMHEVWGEGDCIPGQHTLEEIAEGVGIVTHYDVMFDHGIEQDVPVGDLEVLVSESHMHSKKKGMKEEAEQVDEMKSKSMDLDLPAGYGRGAKWRGGYSASGHPSGYKHKDGKVGPVGGTYTIEPKGYDGTYKRPVAKYRDENDPLSGRHMAGTSAKGTPLTLGSKNRNLKYAIRYAQGKHGPVNPLPEEAEQMDEALKPKDLQRLRNKAKAPENAKGIVKPHIEKKTGIANYLPMRGKIMPPQKIGEALGVKTTHENPLVSVYEPNETGKHVLTGHMNWETARAIHNFPRSLDVGPLHRGESITTHSGHDRRPMVVKLSPHHAKEVVKEEVEQIDELKDSTYAAVVRARSGVEDDLEDGGENWKGDKTKYLQALRRIRRISKRRGSDEGRRLYKKYPPGKNPMANEEVEQVNEGERMTAQRKAVRQIAAYHKANSIPRGARVHRNELKKDVNKMVGEIGIGATERMARAIRDARNKVKKGSPIYSVTEEVEQIDETGIMKKVGRSLAGWGAFDKDKPKDVVKNTRSMSNDMLSQIATPRKNTLKSSPAALQQKVAKRELAKRNMGEQAEQIDEAAHPLQKTIDFAKKHGYRVTTPSATSATFSHPNGNRMRASVSKHGVNYSHPEFSGNDGSAKEFHSTFRDAHQQASEDHAIGKDEAAKDAVENKTGQYALDQHHDGGQHRVFALHNSEGYKKKDPNQSQFAHHIENPSGRGGKVVHMKFDHTKPLAPKDVKAQSPSIPNSLATAVAKNHNHMNAKTIGLNEQTNYTGRSIMEKKKSKAYLAMLRSQGKMEEAKSHTMPRTEKEKKLAALAPPYGKISHADVLRGRGVDMPGKKYTGTSKTLKNYNTSSHNNDSMGAPAKKYTGTPKTLKEFVQQLADKTKQRSLLEAKLPSEADHLVTVQHPKHGEVKIYGMHTTRGVSYYAQHGNGKVHKMPGGSYSEDSTHSVVSDHNNDIESHLGQELSSKQRQRTDDYHDARFMQGRD